MRSRILPLLACLCCFLLGALLCADPIHTAAQEGDLGKVRELLDATPTLVNAARADGLTPLMLAVQKEDLPMVSLLLRKGAGVNAQDKEGRTSLHWAAVQGNLPITDLLLGKGAELDTKDAEG